MSSATLTPGFANEAEWLAERLNGVGASECAAVLGISPYMSALELYYRKTGQLPPITETLPMKVGKLMEPVLIRLYEDATGAKTFGHQRFIRSVEHPFMSATIDAETVRDRSSIIVELKTTNFRKADEWGETGTDEIPSHYLIQTQQQMIVSGCDRVDVAVLIGNADFRVYVVRRNEKLCQSIIRRVGEFWGCVEARKPPPEGVMDARLLASMRPTIEAEIEIDDPLAPEAVRAYVEDAKTIKDTEASRNRLKFSLIEAMQGHASARLVDGTILTRKVIKRKESTVKACEYVDFRIKTPKESPVE